MTELTNTDKIIPGTEETYEEEVRREQEIWSKRAKFYDKINWTSNNSYLEELVHVEDFTDAKVLDVGTGTGKVAVAIENSFSQTNITGIDISDEMLQIAREKSKSIDFIQMDLMSLEFEDNFFDITIARMALHHLVNGMIKGIQEMIRVTKPNGTVIVSEGIPPSPAVIEWYEYMFSFKEVRKALTPHYVFSIFYKENLSYIRQVYHTVKQFSVKNWLENSGLPKEKQEKIFQIHKDAPKEVKQAYNMEITADDCLIDVVFLTTIGHK